MCVCVCVFYSKNPKCGTGFTFTCKVYWLCICVSAQIYLHNCCLKVNLKTRNIIQKYMKWFFSRQTCYLGKERVLLHAIFSQRCLIPVQTCNLVRSVLWNSNDMDCLVDRQAVMAWT